MKADADPVLDASRELRIGWRRHGGKVAGARFSVY
jgi:hypothetical protein